MSVAIFKLIERFEWCAWLCPRHLAEWIERGWQVRERKEPPHDGLTCVDCHFESKGETNG